MPPTPIAPAPSAQRLAQPTPARRRRSARLTHSHGFWVVAGVFAVAMAFSTVPTPLYAIYQKQVGFGPFMVTVVFAAYAVGVVISLLLAGHLSDRLGRRRMLLPAIGLEAAAAVLFLVAPNLPGLIAARFLSGLAIGMILATATAYLAELHRAARPSASASRADLLATAANMGGIGLGPLVSGLLAQYVTGPLRTPYVVFLVLLLVSAAAVAMVPETVEAAGSGSEGYRPQRLSVPAHARSRYLATASAAFMAFAVLGLFTSLAPGFVANVLDRPSRALAGGIAFLVFAAGASAQMLVSRSHPRRQLAGGLIMLAGGLVPVSVGVLLPNLLVFLAGGAIAGAGAGVLFKGAIATAAALAEPGRRGEALAGVFLAAYAGLTVPVLALGVATQVIAVQLALVAFVGVVLVAIAALSRRVLGPAAAYQSAA